LRKRQVAAFSHLFHVYGAAYSSNFVSAVVTAFLLSRPFRSPALFVSSAALPFQVRNFLPNLTIPPSTGSPGEVGCPPVVAQLPFWTPCFCRFCRLPGLLSHSSRHAAYARLTVPPDPRMEIFCRKCPSYLKLKFVPF